MSDDLEKHEILSSSFRRVSQHAAMFSELSQMSRIVRCSPDEVLFRAGEELREFFVLASGTITLTQCDQNGQTHVLRVLRDRGVFGEAAVLGNFPAPVTAQAAASARLVAIEAKKIRDLVERDHQACLMLLQSVVGRVNYLVHHVEELSFCDARTRVARFILDRSNAAHSLSFALDLPKRRLAQQLNLRSETLSRILRDLAQNEVICTTGDRIEIHDLGAIKRLGA